MEIRDVYEKHFNELNYDKEELYNFITNNDLNTCDKCGIILKSYDDGLIWLEYDESPEIKKLPKWILKEGYVALCEWCLSELSKYKNKKQAIIGEL